MVEVSVIVVSYNTRELTLACLRSVYSHTHGVSFEVIVVDNCSHDGSASMVAAEFPSVRLFALDRNLGFAAANNVAMRHASGMWLLLLNPDTVLFEGSIDELVHFGKSKPRAAVIGGQARNADGSLQRNCYEPVCFTTLLIGAFGLHYVAPSNRVFGRARLTYWDYSTPRRVPVVAGCFMLVLRKAIYEVGPMDERFFMYAEEMDWCARFAAAGWEVWYTPAAAITHYGGASTAQVSLDMRRAAQASLLLFLAKYHGGAYVAVCRGIMLMGLALRTPLRLVRSLRDGARLRAEVAELQAIIRLYVGGGRG